MEQGRAEYAILYDQLSWNFGFEALLISFFHHVFHSVFSLERVKELDKGLNMLSHKRGQLPPLPCEKGVVEW